MEKLALLQGRENTPSEYVLELLLFKVLVNDLDLGVGVGLTRFTDAAKLMRVEKSKHNHQKLKDVF